MTRSVRLFAYRPEQGTSTTHISGEQGRALLDAFSMLRGGFELDEDETAPDSCPEDSGDNEVADQAGAWRFPPDFQRGVVMSVESDDEHDDRAALVTFDPSCDSLIVARVCRLDVVHQFGASLASDDDTARMAYRVATERWSSNRSSWKRVV